MLRYAAALVVASVLPAAAQDGAALWSQIHDVLSHPRCVNCHVGEAGVPMWSGPSYGETRPHGMNVKAGESRIGAEYVTCGTCHGPVNADAPHGPPGAEFWLLPPAEFAWFGKSEGEICAQIKDPERNGGRSLEDVAGHVDHDALLVWAWAPGPGRQPAPGTRQDLIDVILAWSEAGAPCPE